jgi:rhodanese-related sulfurtransferase/DNA-binding transcriptional ArsR family regulator
MIQWISRILDMGNRAFKSELYAQFARVGKALSSPHRIEILDLLAQSPRTVESLANELELTIGNASAHLQTLKEARLVEARKDGLYVHYSLADHSVGELLQKMRIVAERRLAEIDRLVKTYLAQRESLESIDLDELAGRVKAGTVVLVDVRPKGEYEAGHIAGAVSIPHNELERRLKELPRTKEVVAYCRGPYCVFADQAVKTLQAHNRKARRFEGGLPEWRSAELPIETSAPSDQQPRARKRSA